MAYSFCHTNSIDLEWGVNAQLCTKFEARTFLRPHVELDLLPLDRLVDEQRAGQPQAVEHPGQRGDAAAASDQGQPQAQVEALDGGNDGARRQDLPAPTRLQPPDLIRPGYERQ